jgi:hypothetical protein
MPVTNPEATYDRRSVLTATCSVLGIGALAGCTEPEERPDLSVLDVRKAVTDDDQVEVSVFVRNDGDASAEVTAEARLERDGSISGPKSGTVSVAPLSQSVERFTFGPGVEGTPALSAYTATGTIPGQDWVSADESEWAVTTEEPSRLSIVDVRKARTDDAEVAVRVGVRNDGDEYRDVTVTARLERDGTVYGPKTGEVAVDPGGEKTARITFDPTAGSDPAAYTASGTIPGSGWVIAGESA